MEGYRVLDEFPDYEISPDGKIFSSITGTYLAGSTNQEGYRKVTLLKDGKKYTRFVHRLVATAWIPNEHGLPLVSFKDHDKTHICVDNLEWADMKRVCNTAFQCGHRNIETLKELGREKRKLSIDQVKEAKQLHSQGLAFKKIAKIYGVSYETVRDAVSNKLYKEIV